MKLWCKYNTFIFTYNSSPSSSLGTVEVVAHPDPMASDDE